MRRFLLAAAPELQPTFKLKTTDFPPKLIADEAMTVQAAGLGNSVVMVIN